MTTRTNSETRVDVASANSISDEAIEQIRQSLKGLRYGTVTIVVQDGLVIQIERTEKRRLKKTE